MRHLSEEELLDLAEVVGAGTAHPHLLECEVCAAQVRELRAVIAATMQVDVPEPSPLFWEHFSGRVRAGIAGGDRAAGRSWIRSWQFALPAAAALAAVVLVAVAMLRTPDVMLPAGQQAMVAAPAELFSAPALADDPSFDLIGDLVQDLDDEAAAEAGLTLGSAALERVVFEMSEDERRELRRILQQEMGRQGA